MTTTTDIVNRALQVPGTRTTVTDAELAANSTNEAIQANLKLDTVRRRLLRMAPWNCGLRTANLVSITSSPGTPENLAAPTTLWQPGQPSPPWNYEYQYPVDCIRACWVIPATQTGFAGGIPITTAVTGGAASFWQGPPVKFKVMTDLFFGVTGASVTVGGINYVVGEIITLTNQGNAPAGAGIGAPLQLMVTSIGPGGAVAGVSIIPIVSNSNPALGGSYFLPQASPVVQGTSSGAGTGASFLLTFNTTATPQRVILCNQE